MTSTATQAPPRTRSADERKRQILDAAARLMVEKGSAGVSVQDIADEAGVSVGLIYRHFGGKSDVVTAVVVDVLDGFARELPKAVSDHADPIRRLHAAFDAFSRIIDSRRHATVLTYRESKGLPAEALEILKEREVETAAPIAEAISAAVDQGLFRRVDAEAVAETMVLIAHGWALKNWFFSRRGTLDDFIAAQFGMAVSALLTSESRERYADLLGPFA